jgi:predicted aminopeptidase
MKGGKKYWAVNDMTWCGSIKLDRWPSDSKLAFGLETVDLFEAWSIKFAHLFRGSRLAYPAVFGRIEYSSESGDHAGGSLATSRVSQLGKVLAVEPYKLSHNGV